MLKWERLMEEKIRAPYERQSSDAWKYYVVDREDNAYEEHQQKILGRGRTNFRIPYQEKGSDLILSVEEKVALYCQCYFKHHADRSQNAFGLAASCLKSPSIAFIDIGCGPFTSGAALKRFYFEEKFAPRHLEYHGYDIAPAMRKKAEEIAEYSNGLYFSSVNRFYGDIENLHALRLPDCGHIIINASYFLAARTLDIAKFLRLVRGFVNIYIDKPVYIFYLNPKGFQENWDKVKRVLAPQGLQLSSPKHRIDENTDFEVLSTEKVDFYEGEFDEDEVPF